MSILQMIKSICAAILGIRSEKDAQADFEKINYRWYIVFSCLIVLLVIAGLVILVKIII